MDEPIVPSRSQTQLIYNAWLLEYTIYLSLTFLIAAVQNQLDSLPNSLAPWDVKV